jgi:hypothetical protein
MARPPRFERSRRLGRVVFGGRNAEAIVVAQIDSTENGTTQTRGTLDNGVENWLGIGR